MKTWKIGLLFFVLLVMVSTSVYAQSRNNQDAQAAAGCAVCGGFLMLPVIIFILNIVLLIWVARDAKARGMDGSAIWMILVLFTSVLGLILYIFSRPAGNLVACPKCQNSRLEVSAKCPHCGNA